MNFANEHFVRLYTRDSRTWLRWGWEGQAVFALTARKLDALGRLTIEDAFADVALLTGLPETIVRVGLQRIIDSGTFVVRDGMIECPNWIDGQTATKSDSVRCREYRERLKACRVIPRVERSTDTARVEGDTKRPRATRRDTRSSNPTQPNPTQPNPTQPNPVHGEDPADPPRAKRSAAPSAEALAVFEQWRTILGHPRAQLDRRRDAIIQARIRDGFTVEDLVRACRGATKSDWHMGRDQRSNGARYDGIETILRDRAQVEKFIELEAAPASAAHGSAAQVPRKPQLHQPNCGLTGFEIFQQQEARK